MDPRAAAIVDRSSSHWGEGAHILAIIRWPPRKPVIVLNTMKKKWIRFLPIAFLAGMHGFALFAPYVVLVLAAAHVIKRRG